MQRQNLRKRAIYWVMYVVGFWIAWHVAKGGF